MSTDPTIREACRQQLARELVSRTLLHDIRGSLTAVMGWMELAAMDGTRLPGGLERSIDGLKAVLDRYDGVTWDGSSALTPAGQAIAEVLEIPVQGGELPLPLDGLRLISALELAAPTAVQIADDPDLPGVRYLRLEGMPDEAIRMALSPHHEDLLARLAAPDQALGATLLREVIRRSRGELRKRAPGSLDLLMPLD